MNDKYYLQQAINASQESVDAGGYPAGAIVVQGDEIISVGFANCKNLFDATLHAEIDAIRKASSELSSRDLENAVLYCTMEPCVMCFSACFWAHIPKIGFACSRSQIDQKWYMGNHDIQNINEKNYRRKIELIHLEECSQEALKIIHDWEKAKD
jgi:guanine deaminase